MGNFQGTSTITVSGNLELEQTGNYHFVLYPAPNFPSNFVLIVTFPIQLVCGSSCSSNQYFIYQSRTRGDANSNFRIYIRYIECEKPYIAFPIFRYKH